MMAMTLEQIRDEIRACVSPLDGYHSPKFHRWADAIDAHIAGMGEVVDVVAIREVIELLLEGHTDDEMEIADKLTSAIGTTQEGLFKVGTLTVQRWKGIDSMVNTDFDYAADLSDGNYTAYVLLPTPPTDGEG